MRKLASCFLFFAVGFTGCVTKTQADARARIAFLEGQNQALMRLQNGAVPPEPVIPSVTFVGPVLNSSVKWRTGLTLSQAIVSAQYTGPGDPAVILIHREGQEIPINPKNLLRGEDLVLQAGDVVEIRQ